MSARRVYVLLKLLQPAKVPLRKIAEDPEAVDACGLNPWAINEGADPNDTIDIADKIVDAIDALIEQRIREYHEISGGPEI